MRELVLKLTLLEDVIVNERPANEGGHAGLDYLPGVLLLGAAAARLYDSVPGETAWRLFHSGQVRFGDALPLRDDLPAWPVPLCWHEKKGDSAKGDGDWLDAEKIHNQQFVRRADGAQPKQMRDGYIRGDGLHLQVKRSLRMKTAIDPETGRVAEAQLFGYESMMAGQSFVARIHADESIPEDLCSQLFEALTETGELLLGRSRSAEYGRTRVEVWPSSAPLVPASGAPANDILTLWCLSDLALLDDWGQPTLEPTPTALGLTRGEIDWERTFLRFRRYAIWNQHRNGYDTERQVIRHGSVIALKHLGGPLADDERRRLVDGVGLYREAGLGRMSLDPVLLSTAQPAFAPRDLVHEVRPRPSVPKPNHPLIQWLAAGQHVGSERRQAEESVRGLRDTLKKCYDLAHAYAGVPKNLPIGPSPAQWGTVYEKARLADSEDLAALRAQLFDDGNAICKATGEGWQDPFRDNAGVRSFFDWFKAQIGAAHALSSVQKLRLFTREAQRVARAEYAQSASREDAA